MNLPGKQHLVLVGGGHAHLLVLEHLARSPHPELDVTLISPSRWQIYSGMVPGWMAGHYELDECRVDLQQLSRRAGATMIEMPIAGMDAERGCVGLATGEHIDYDWLSLDVGSETDLTWLAALDERLVPLKPMDAFVRAWRTIVEQVSASRHYSLAIVGGGAAGVEVALNARRALANSHVAVKIQLIVGDEGLLAGFSAHAARTITRWLREAQIEIIESRAVGIADGVMLSDGRNLRVDRVIAATGPRPPVWLSLSRLQLDQSGFATVDATHRSLSHPNVFAAGDICARPGTHIARSGVHSVRAGPVLAQNLLAVAAGRPLITFHPRRRVLFILADGNQRALFCFGPICASGRWAWRIKDWIDRRFIARFFDVTRDQAGVAHRKGCCPTESEHTE